MKKLSLDSVILRLIVVFCWDCRYLCTEQSSG